MASNSENVRSLIDRARTLAGQGNEANALSLLHEALSALNHKSLSTERALSTKGLMEEAARLVSSHGSSSSFHHGDHCLAESLTSLLAGITIGQQEDHMDVDLASMQRGAPSTSDNAGGNGSHPPNHPLLCETDREGIIGCALADGSSFICPICQGVFAASRRQHHSLWCDST
jgi:hypothetical protein